MRIRILYLGLVRDKVGKRTDEFNMNEGSTLSDLLKELAETYGKSLGGLFVADKQSRLDPTLIATVNGTLRDPFRGDEVTLRDGDTVALMTLISGG